MKGKRRRSIIGIKTRTVRSLSPDPWHNQALEEHLLSDVAQDEVILYLWQNQHTVVIGRNQNPWKECRCQELEESGGKLARRMSGGGAVYHDMGNLNFTFVMRSERYDLSRQLQVILGAVRALGVNAEFSGRNDLVVDGRKFSGNAFYRGKTASYHHGTVMVGIDPAHLGKFLQVSKAKMASKGVDSVRSRVVNLSNLVPGLTVEDVVASLNKSFGEVYAPPSAHEVHDGTETYGNLYDKYASWDWRYGLTPAFDVVYETRFPWGGIELGLKAEHAHITSATIYSDAMNAGLIADLAAGLKGQPFDLVAVAEWIGRFPVGPEDAAAIADLREWLLGKARGRIELQPGDHGGTA